MRLGLGNMLSKVGALLPAGVSGLFTYFQPDGVSAYKRPDGTSIYKRP
jgi:hypothetical protein